MILDKVLAFKCRKNGIFSITKNGPALVAADKKYQVSMIIGMFDMLMRSYIF